jgi:small-conductance mechanosensitive channel
MAESLNAELQALREELDQLSQRVNAITAINVRLAEIAKRLRQIEKEAVHAA